MSILRKIFKTGNSSVISVPSHILEELGLNDGDNVILARLCRGNKVVGIEIIKAETKKKKE